MTQTNHFEILRDLDDTVQKTKYINDMVTSLRKKVYDWTDADEVLDEVDAIKAYCKVVTKELDNRTNTLWNDVVYKKTRSRIGSDLDSL